MSMSLVGVTSGWQPVWRSTSLIRVRSIASFGEGSSPAVGMPEVQGLTPRKDGGICAECLTQKGEAATGQRG